MASRVNLSLPPADGLGSDEASGYSPHGPDAAKYLPYRNFGMRASGGQCSNARSKPPAIQPLSKPRDWRTLPGGFIGVGSPNLASEVRLEPDNNDPTKHICWSHLPFDDPCAKLERTRTVFPQLSRNVHRPGNLHPCSLSKELSHSHSGSPNLASEVRLEPDNNDPDKDICGRRLPFDPCAKLERTRTVLPQLSRNVHRPGNLHPCSLSKELSHSHSGYRKRDEVNTTPALRFPSTNTFTIENLKLSSRPSVKYPTTPNLLNVKDQKSQSYPDPVVGASRAFINRLSELSSLDGETARQEKRMRKPKKTTS